MFTSEPWWLFWTKAFIERARPFVNWIGGAYVLLWFIGTYLAVGFGLGLEQTMTGSCPNWGEFLVLWLLFNVMGVPWSIIAWGALLLIVLMNVKFSIGWRQ